MASDYQMLRKGMNSFSDYMQLEDEFRMKKEQAARQAQMDALTMQKAQKEIETGAASNDPAALRLANEYEAAIKSGDTDRANRIAAFSKIYDKNVMQTPDGQYVPLPGLPQALGNLKYGENLGGETATQQVRSAYEPGRAEDIARRQAGVDLYYDPLTAARTEQQKLETQKAVESLADFDKAGLAYNETKKILSGLKSPDGAGLDSGVSAVVGFRNPFKGALPFNYNIGGTVAAGGQARINQLRGKTFLEAYETLKGGGAITEVEGAKAEAAKARLDQAQTEDDFLAALNDFEYEVDQLYNLVQKKQYDAQQKMQSLNQGGYIPPMDASMLDAQTPALSVPTPPTPNVPQKGDVLDGYMFLGGDPGNEKSWKKVR